MGIQRPVVQAGRRAASTLRSWEPAPAGRWQEPSRRDGRIQLAVELKAAQAVSGQGALPGPAGHALGTVRAAARAAVPIPWILAQHKPACLCCIPRPRSGPTWDFWLVLPHRTYLQGRAGRCRRVRGRHAVRQHRSHLAL